MQLLNERGGPQDRGSKYILKMDTAGTVKELRNHKRKRSSLAKHRT